MWLKKKDQVNQESLLVLNFQDQDYFHLTKQRLRLIIYSWSKRKQRNPQLKNRMSPKMLKLIKMMNRQLRMKRRILKQISRVRNKHQHFL